MFLMQVFELHVMSDHLKKIVW